MGTRLKRTKAVATTKIPRTVETVAVQLGTFLQSHPETTIGEIDGANGKRLAILRPWGDKSIALSVPDDLAPFAAALNNLVLPSRYAAIWHRDTKDFEILWTAFIRRPPVAEVVGRQFSFTWRATAYECEFTHASERTALIARNFLPIGATETGYRNLDSFRTHAKGPPSYLKHLIGEPLSFWIRNVEWNEADVLSLVLHLNFYMRYFDALSPVIVIYSPPPKTSWESPVRYIAGAFPKNIKSQDVDTNALFLWEAARQGDNQRRFLYYYRIIEYSSSFYLDATARIALRMALALPNALDDLTAVTESVVSAVQKMKMDEAPRFEAMLKEVIDPGLLWRELNRNLAAFTTEIEFDGGYKTPPLFASGRLESSFTQNDVSVFAFLLFGIFVITCPTEEIRKRGQRSLPRNTISHDWSLG